MTSKHTLTVYSADNKFANSKIANWTTSKPELMSLSAKNGCSSFCNSQSRIKSHNAKRNIYKNHLENLKRSYQQHEDRVLESRTVERTSTSTPLQMCLFWMYIAIYGAYNKWFTALLLACPWAIPALIHAHWLARTRAVNHTYQTAVHEQIPLKHGQLSLIWQLPDQTQCRLPTSSKCVSWITDAIFICVIHCI